MSVRILAQSDGVMKLEYDIRNKKVVTDKGEYNNVDGLYFEGNVYMAGSASYSQGVVEIDFDLPVTVSLETVNVDGQANVLNIKQPQAKSQALVGLKWKPGELIGRLIGGGGGRGKTPVATKVRDLYYDPATKRATAYNSDKKTFENVTTIRFQGVGDGSRIQTNVLHIVPPEDYYFVVKQSGNTLTVENERGA